MAARGRKATKRATAARRKKPVPEPRKIKSGTAKSAKPKSAKPKSVKPKSRDPKPTNSQSENARLKSELRAARDRQAAGAEVMRLIGASPGDANLTLRRIAEVTERLFGASSVSLLIADGERWGQTIRVGAGSERIATAIPLAHVAITPQFMPGAVYLENRQVHVADSDDPAAMARWPGLTPARAAGTRTMSGTPLRREGAAIGALIVHRNRLEPFTADELELQQSFADQAVIAIENARLFNESKEALARQTATSDILRVISQSPTNVQPVFEAIVLTAVRLLRCDWSSFLLCDSTSFWPAASAGPEGPRPVGHGKAPLDPDANFPSRAIASKKTLHLPDWSLIDLPEHERDIHQITGTNSALYLPLLREGECTGLLALTGKRAGIFGESEIALAESFRDQAVIAIENVRLFDEVKAKTADLSESLQQQTATADVLKVISRSVFDLQTVLDTLVESAYKLCGANLGLLYLRGDEAFECKAIAGVGVAEATVLFKGRPIRAGRGTAAERVIMTGEVHSITDFFEDPEMDPKVRETIRNAAGSNSSIAQIRSTLAVPMTRDSVVIGVMVIARSRTGPFPPRQIELLRTFADQAVIAIENARLFDEVQTRTKELAASLDELRTAQDRLVQTEKLASLGQLTAGIAHEIKNPLNFVNNFSALSAELVDELNDVLRPAALDGKMRDEIDELTQLLKGNLEKVVQHGKRADSIVKNMLLHSREGSGEQRSVDVNALLDESLNLAYHGARAEKPGFNITLQRDFDADVTAIEAFPQEITRVFLNLITNGFYAAAKRQSESGDSSFEPLLRATTKNIGDAVEIRIRDNGTGIPAEVKEKIFNPFFTTKPAGEGTGLGLSMSHDIIVKQHGGSIDVTTVPGQFTEFTIVLPKTNNFSKD